MIASIDPRARSLHALGNGSARPGNTRAPSSPGGRHGEQDVKGRPGGNCRRGGRGRSPGAERSLPGLGNRLSLRSRSTHLSLSLGARCNLRLPDDFQIGSGRHFFARCVPHLPPHPGHEKRNRRKPGGEERGERVIAVPRHIVCIIPDVHPAVFSR